MENGKSLLNNYFIIHGSEGKPFENWFPWLEEELTSKKRKVIVPQFPSPDGQNYDNWSKILKTYLELGLINENTVFIGHSLAPIFICKFLIENKIKVKGLIAVAGFNELLGLELDEINKTFLMEYEELEKIIDYTKFIYCFYSDNDPYIKKEYLEKFIKAVKGERNLVKNAGHFNARDGYTKFPLILEVIRQVEGKISLFEDCDMPIGVNAIILNDKGEILLSRRINRIGEGTYGLIGGKLKKGETFEEGMIRELKEEIDIEVKKEDIEVINLANTIDKQHFIQIGILIKKYTGTIQNKEPNKCNDLQFFSLDNLPTLFLGNKPNIMLFKSKQFYNRNENVKE